MGIDHLADYKVNSQKFQYQCYLAVIFLAIYNGYIHGMKSQRQARVHVLALFYVPLPYFLV
jgi:hypothetical protein